MKTIQDIKTMVLAKQKAIQFESSEDEGAAEYYAELESIVEACDTGDLNKVIEAAKYVGFSLKESA